MLGFLIDPNFYLGLVLGGAIIWLFRAFVEKWKAKAEAKLKR